MKINTTDFCVCHIAPSGRPEIISTWKDSNQIGLKIKLPDFMEWNGNLTGYLVSYKVEGSEETRTFVEIGMHDEVDFLYHFH